MEKIQRGAMLRCIRDYCPVLMEEVSLLANASTNNRLDRKRAYGDR